MAEPREQALKAHLTRMHAGIEARAVATIQNAAAPVIEKFCEALQRSLHEACGHTMDHRVMTLVAELEKTLNAEAAPMAANHIMTKILDKIVAETAAEVDTPSRG